MNIFKEIPHPPKVSFKTSSDMMAVTFTDFNKFGTYRKAMEQWSQKAKNSCQKFELRLKILEKLRQKGGKFSVL